MLEGGGQILRNTAALAAIAGRPVRVTNIRAARSKPGLRPQHLAGLQLVARIANADLQGAAVGSTTIVLSPGRLAGGHHSADPGTAGSCALLAQAALPCLMAAAGDGESVLDLRGGTDATLAPPVGYMQHVLLPMLHSLFGLQVDIQLFKRGFYPRGGGHMQLIVGSPAHRRLPGVMLTQQPSWQHVTIRAFTAGQVGERVGQRMVQAAQKVIRAELGADISISRHIQRESPESAVGNGCGILLTATTAEGTPILGAAGLGERGVTAEAVGEKAALELAEDIAAGACIDRWLQDQIVVFLALADGPSQIRCGEPTLHTRTAMVVAEQLTSSKFRILQPDAGEQTFMMHCTGRQR